MTQPASSRGYDPSAYQKLGDPIKTWQEIAARQRAKDQVLIPLLTKYFVTGRVLELGAGVGQLSLMFQTLGWQVVASDYQDFFVRHQRGLGLDAHQVDATDIEAAGLGKFSNIFCHSISPFITHDYDVVARTYGSTRQALDSGGRLVMVNGMEPWRDVAGEMARHAKIAREAGFTEVNVFRNQLLPSKAYRPPLTSLAKGAEILFGKSLGSRFVLVAS